MKKTLAAAALVLTLAGLTGCTSPTANSARIQGPAQDVAAVGTTATVAKTPQAVPVVQTVADVSEITPSSPAAEPEPEPKAVCADGKILVEDGSCVSTGYGAPTQTATPKETVVSPNLVQFDGMDNPIQPLPVQPKGVRIAADSPNQMSGAGWTVVYFTDPGYIFADGSHLMSTAHPINIPKGPVAVLLSPVGGNHYDCTVDVPNTNTPCNISSQPGDTPTGGVALAIIKGATCTITIPNTRYVGTPCFLTTVP